MSLDLCWVHYKNEASRKYLLLLHLGTRQGKFVGLLSDRVSQQDANLIKKLPSGLGLEERLKWIKERCPISFRNAYREIYQNRIEVVQRYPLN